jgi:hypothetical protein
MSRILKRPMFRIGGSANEGIVSMAQPRRNYNEGSLDKSAEEYYKLLERFAGPGPSTSSDLGDLLISGGLNLMSGRGAGKGTLGAIAESYREPYQTFSKARAGEDAFKRQLRLSAATQAISSDEAMRLAKIKYGMEVGKEQEQRKKELMQQYEINYTEADTFQNFLNQKDTIGKTVGLPVSSAPLFLTFKNGKYEVPGAKNMPEGIYYDPRNNKYVKIKSGTPIIGDSIRDIVKPENQVVSQQSYRDYINEELAKKRKAEIESEGYTSFDTSSP